MPTKTTQPAASDSVGQVCLRIEDMILRGELAPGTHLREIPLAEQLGVRRGPLREAIRVLEGRRLLTRTPNAGVSVIAPNLQDCEQLLVTREALEGIAARLAAQNITSGELDELRRVASLMENDPDVPLGVFDTGPDADFHRLIAVCSRNRRIEQLLCVDLYSELRFFRSRTVRGRRAPAESHGEHRAIIDALHRRDGDAAEDAMRTHVRRSRLSLLERLGPQD